MCSPFVWWWIIFSTILVSGAFGGYARYQWEVSEGNGKVGLRAYVVTGVASSLLVPLFLNTISSSIIVDIPENQDKLLILIGFSVAAGTFAKQFIGSVAKKALELSKQANATAEAAKVSADDANIEARKADNRALALYTAMGLIQAQMFAEALQEIEHVLDADPNNGEAQAWKAYCCKRLGDFSGAISSIVRALENEAGEIHTWLYNLACYKCLANHPVHEVIDVLKRASAAATPAQLRGLPKDLEEDEDFGKIHGHEEFKLYIKSLT